MDQESTCVPHPSVLLNIGSIKFRGGMCSHDHCTTRMHSSSIPHTRGICPSPIWIFFVFSVDQVTLFCRFCERETNSNCVITSTPRGEFRTWGILFPSQWRIQDLPEMGAPTPKVDVEKLLFGENDRIWIPEGERPWHPSPLDPPMHEPVVIKEKMWCRDHSKISQKKPPSHNSSRKIRPPIRLSQ